MRALFLMVFCFFVMSTPAMAAVEVGQPLPTQLELMDKNGDAQSFDTITGEKAPELLAKFSVRYKFDHVMLSDQGSETIKAFGILNENFAPDHFAYGVPKPHVYVVAADGTVQAVLAEETYKKRPQVDAIVEAIEGIR